MEDCKKRGLLVIVSGPSGVGKGTIVKKLLERKSDVEISISATTRQPRCGEVNGIDYKFISKDEFLETIAKDGFLEYVQYNENYYGTPKENTYNNLINGKDVILEIEVKGACKVKDKYKEAIMIFVMPPCHQELYTRLKCRNTEEDTDIKRRLEEAQREIKVSDSYDYIVINDSVDKAVDEIIEILETEKLKMQEK